MKYILNLIKSNFIVYLNLITFYYWGTVIKFNYFFRELLSVIVQNGSRWTTSNNVPLILAKRSILKYI